MSFGNAVRNHRFLIALLVVASCIAALSIANFGPREAGDTGSYVEAMEVLRGTSGMTEFAPVRILTTSGGLVSVLLLAPLFGLMPAWLLMNVFFYLLLAFAAFMLINETLRSERAAFLGALFIVGSYAPVVFGLNHLMDAGGWALAGTPNLRAVF